MVLFYTYLTSSTMLQKIITVYSSLKYCLLSNTDHWRELRSNHLTLFKMSFLYVTSSFFSFSPITYKYEWQRNIRFFYCLTWSEPSFVSNSSFTGNNHVSGGPCWTHLHATVLSPSLARKHCRSCAICFTSRMLTVHSSQKETGKFLTKWKG